MIGRIRFSVSLRFLIFLAAISAPFRLSARTSSIVTILIENGRQSINISSPEGMMAEDMNGSRKVFLAKGSSYRAVPVEGGIDIRGQGFSDMLRLVPNGEFMRVNGRAFRGGVILKKEGVHLAAVNEVEVEDYLRGVLPRELSPAWDEEVLKAQAVVSRTYIMANIGRFAKQGYDLTACENSQVYGGKDVEQASTDAAVSATAGEVIKYRGEIARVYFHADAAGHTESPEFVWSSSEPPPYLKGRREPVRNETPYSSWEYEISFEELERVLEKNGYKTGRIRRVALRGRSSSGRAKNFVVHGASSQTEIKSGKFRTMLGGRNIKSTKITKLVNIRNSVIFMGAGWGHGVGMSQWGAKELAERGWSYKKIIGLYFPGTGIAAR